MPSANTPASAALVKIQNKNSGNFAVSLTVLKKWFFVH